MRAPSIAACLLIPFLLAGENRIIDIGGRRLLIDCEGAAQRSPTVILVSGAGRLAKDWAPVQPEIAKFARVCSYDRAGLGESDKTAKDQPVDEVIDDLHKLLRASGEKAPFI